MSRFSDAEIADMIDEVGDYIEFAIREESSPGDPAKGIPASYTYTSRRRIKAYIVQKDISVPVAGGSTKFGVLQAYIMGRSVDVSEFTNKALIFYEGTAYHLEYQDDIRSQGKLILHKVRLLTADTYTKVESPDGVIRQSTPEPKFEFLPPGSPGSPGSTPSQTVLQPTPVPFAPIEVE